LSDQETNEGNHQASGFGGAVVLRTEAERLKEEHAEEKRRENRYHKRQLLFNGILTVTTVVTAAIASYQGYLLREYTRLTKISAEAAKSAAETASNQFTLMEKQLIYTQSAKVGVQAIITLPPPEPKGITITTLYINLFNDGHETASHIRADFHLTEKTVPGERLIGKSKPLSVTVPFGLTPVQDPRPGPFETHNEFRREYRQPVSAEAARLITNADISLELRGTLAYFNGFIDVTVPVCFRYISYTCAKCTVQPNFISCEDFQSGLASALNGKKQDSKQQN
jgi:hypothetical protein